jgi:fructose transport system substrate-binding protein
MIEGAEEAAAANGVDLTIGSGKEEGDDQGQIDLIENAIAQGQAGILITPMSVNVNDAISRARDAGLYVIALDTPTDPPDVVDITFATDNCLAGEAIGQWAAGKLNGDKAVIAELVIFDDRVVSVDYCRANGFLTGMGIDVPVLEDMTSPADSGSYTTGAGGDYEIACLEATGANEEGGRKGMENCLAANPDINVVYTINEPTAFGAAVALEAAGKTVGEDVIILSVDGGLAGVEAVKAGSIQATSQQYPLRMASLGVEAIKTIADGGAPPENTSANGEFFDTGVTLCTDDPMDTVTSAPQESAQYCIDNAWG